LRGAAIGSEGVAIADHVGGGPTSNLAADPGSWRGAVESAARHVSGIDGLDRFASASFRVGDETYGSQFDDYPPEELDEASVTVVDIAGGQRQFFYDYDFGDGWELEVVVEEVTSWPWGLKHGVCLDGQRACPPEDVGGPYGYAAFLEVLADPSHEEHEVYVNWSGGGFDPEQFSVAGTNVALQQLRIKP
jgi:Plasmid pRiA4b ORF-3-like protein